MRFSSGFAALIYLSALALPAQALPYRDEVLADNPLAYWRLGDAAGPNVSDETGNGYTGTAGAGVVFQEPSMLLGDPADLSIRLTGNDSVTVGGFEKFGVGATGYTVEYWFTYVESGSNLHYSIISDGEAGGDFFLMNYLTNNPSDRHLRTHVGPGAALDSTLGLTPGQSYYVVSTWDQATGEVSIYIDGVLDNSTNVGVIAAVNTDNPMYLGPDLRETFGTDLALDEVAIYDYALSGTQISGHFAAAAVPEPGSATLTLLGLATMASYRRRRRRPNV